MKKRHRSRPRVLALHAAGATPAMFDDVAAAAPELDLLAPDLVPLTLAVGGRLGPLLRALAAMVPAGPVTLTGCSVGANIALELAAQLGDRVQGVLLLNPQPLRPDALYRERSRQFGKLLKVQMGVDEILAWVPLVVYRGGARWKRAAPQAEAMLRAAGGPHCAPLVHIAADLPECAGTLKRVHAPIRALFAAENVNPLLGPAWLTDWEKALGRDAAEVVPETRFWLPLEAPEMVAAALRELATGSWREGE